MMDFRPEPFFIGDSPALDFLNSIAEPRSVEFEWLSSGADVLDWLVKAGLLSDEETTELRQRKHRASLDLAAKEIRMYREEFRTFVSLIIDEGQICADDPMIKRIDGLMRGGTQSLRLVQTGDDGHRFVLKVVHQMQSAEDLLPRIASACAEFIAVSDLARLRKCQGAGCTLFFYDMSKNHKRRWCSMEVCGNRAKAAAYRKRS